MRLKGKTALVTAASSGIGLGVARRFREEGASVFISGYEPDLTAQAAEEVGAVGYAVADFRRPEEVEAVGRAALEALGHVDILFYNTGGPKPGRFLELTPEDWEEAYRLILDSAIRLTRTVLPGMVERAYGRLLYSTSSGVVMPLPLLHLSNVMRAGVAALALSLAPEVGPFGITTHVLAPAHIVTARHLSMQRYRAEKEGLSPEAYRLRELRTIPVGRFGRVEDVAALAAFLASEEGGYLTGQVHPVDGGYTRMVALYSEVYTADFTEERLGGEDGPVG
jgi:3-oxoacyl-[acyl-carrier protein] reductase